MLPQTNDYWPSTVLRTWREGRSASPDLSLPETYWRARLPPEWLSMVVSPLTLHRHREYEALAERVFGEDEDGRRCFYEHVFVLVDGRSDNDEDYYSVLTYGESVRAWRLRDERWLIHRVIRTDEAERAALGFYSFSEQCPR